MATIIETAIFENMLQIFGNNPILLAAFAVGITFFLLMMLRIPMQLIMPILAIMLIIIGLLIPAVTVILGLIAGVMLAYFVIRLWQGV